LQELLQAQQQAQELQWQAEAKRENKNESKWNVKLSSVPSEKKNWPKLKRKDSQKSRNLIVSVAIWFCHCLKRKSQTLQEIYIIGSSSTSTTATTFTKCITQTNNVTATETAITYTG